MPSLLDMTDVPMTNILEQCDFKSVLILRKVCHDLRNFIDDANFKTELSMLLITINSIDFSLRSYSKNDDPVYAADHCTSNDLKIILGIQNSKLFNFLVVSQSDDPGNWDALEEVMKNKPRSLQTEWLNLKVSRGSQALKILPFLDAKVLKNISLIPPDGAFTTSTHMNCFSLGKYEMDNERFEGVFGEALDYAYKEGEIILYETKKWYFKIRTSKQQVLEINFLLMIRRLTFKRVEIFDVVENAIVRD